jgi:hypothetical protein
VYAHNGDTSIDQQAVIPGSSGKNGVNVGELAAGAEGDAAAHVLDADVHVVTPVVGGDGGASAA